MEGLNGGGMGKGHLGRDFYSVRFFFFLFPSASRKHGSLFSTLLLLLKPTLDSDHQCELSIRGHLTLFFLSWMIRTRRCQTNDLWVTPVHANCDIIHQFWPFVIPADRWCRLAQGFTSGLFMLTAWNLQPNAQTITPSGPRGDVPAVSWTRFKHWHGLQQLTSNYRRVLEKYGLFELGWAQFYPFRWLRSLSGMSTWSRSEKSAIGYVVRASLTCFEY